MKRSQPLRRTALKRGMSQLKRTALRRQSSKERTRQIELQASRAVVMSRSDGHCEVRVPQVCRGRGEHAHHIQPRSRGRDDSPANLLWCCPACHGWIHDHPGDAKDQGWLR